VQAEHTLEAKIVEAKVTGENQIQLNAHELDMLSQWQQQSTWKDEYVTVSVVAIFNLILVGGVLAAFGRREVLRGVESAVVARLAAVRRRLVAIPALVVGCDLSGAIESPAVDTHGDSPVG
jgi:hypothetical protein